MWIGWELDLSCFCVRLDPGKFSRLCALLRDVLRSRRCSTHLLERVTGKLLWFSALLRTFRPSLSPLYATSTLFSLRLRRCSRSFGLHSGGGNSLRSALSWFFFTNFWVRVTCLCTVCLSATTQQRKLPVGRACQWHAVCAAFCVLFCSVNSHAGFQSTLITSRAS